MRVCRWVRVNPLSCLVLNEGHRFLGYTHALVNPSLFLALQVNEGVDTALKAAGIDGSGAGPAGKGPAH